MRNGELKYPRDADGKSVCPVCGLSFDPSYISRHVQGCGMPRKRPTNPTKPTPVRCPECGLLFAPSNIARHRRAMHNVVAGPRGPGAADDRETREWLTELQRARETMPVAGWACSACGRDTHAPSVSRPNVCVRCRAEQEVAA